MIKKRIDLTKDFDDSVKLARKMSANSMSLGQQLALTTMLSDIKVFGYDTIEQVEGAIYNRLEALKPSKIGDIECTKGVG